MGLLFIVDIFSVFNENNGNDTCFDINTIYDSIIAHSNSTMTYKTISEWLPEADGLEC